MDISNASEMWAEQVGHLPLQQAITLPSDTPISAVISTMQKHRCGCIILLGSNKEVVGLFTERDLMKKFVGTSLSASTKVEEVMTANPFTLKEDDSVSQAVYVMGKKHFRHLPILTKKKEVKGLLSVRVLVYFIAENLPRDVLNLPPDERKIPKQVEGG